MYKKYLKLILVIILLILIVLRSWNLIIIGSVLLLFIINIKSLLVNKHNKHVRIMEKMYCRKSDINNPMGNVLLYTDKDELEYNICPNEDIEHNLNFNIYNDKKDLFFRRNNVRPFITKPSIYHPNDLNNVKNNLYNYNIESCKLNSTNCAFNENIKYHKSYFLSNEIKTNT